MSERRVRDVYMANARASARRAWILRGEARIAALAAAADWTRMALSTPKDELMPEVTAWGLGPEPHA